MASSLKKYKYSGSTVSRSEASTRESTQTSPTVATSSNVKANANANATSDLDDQPDISKSDTIGLNSELLLSINNHIAVALKEELKKALSEDFEEIKTQVHSVKQGITGCMETILKEIDEVQERFVYLEQWSGLYSNYGNNPREWSKGTEQ